MATSTRADDPAVGDRRRIGTVAVVAHGKKTLGGGLDELRAYELDGGDRDTADRLTACAIPGALTVCVPDG